jgi:hypothetical protein
MERYGIDKTEGERMKREDEWSRNDKEGERREGRDDLEKGSMEWK